MTELFKPVEPKTPQEEVVRALEDLILEGKLSPGDKLPPERELALAMKVSRPVIHEGLLELTAKGLIRMVPRHGCWVNDYRRSGSLELLNALYRYDRGALEPSLDEGLEEMRSIILNTSVERLLKPENEKSLKEALTDLAEELKLCRQIGDHSPGRLAESDFNFYYSIVYHSGNPVFPLTFNSAKEMYIGLLTRFFSHHGYASLSAGLKEQLLHFLEMRDRDNCMDVLKKLCYYATYGQGHGE